MYFENEFNVTLPVQLLVYFLIADHRHIAKSDYVSHKIFLPNPLMVLNTNKGHKAE